MDPGERLREERDGGSGGQQPCDRARWPRRRSTAARRASRGATRRAGPARLGRRAVRSPSSLWIGAARRLPATIPPKQPVERPAAEAAVLVVEHEVSFHTPSAYEERRAGGRAGSPGTMPRDVPGRLRSEPVRHELLAARRGRERGRGDRGSRLRAVEACGRCSSAPEDGRLPILLTHAHIDHAYAAGDLAGDDVPVFIHQDDAVAFEDIDALEPRLRQPARRR